MLQVGDDERVLKYRSYSILLCGKQRIAQFSQTVQKLKKNVKGLWHVGQWITYRRPHIAGINGKRNQNERASNREVMLNGVEDQWNCTHYPENHFGIRNSTENCRILRTVPAVQLLETLSVWYL